jgi:hypothetical protein
VAIGVAIVAAVVGATIGRTISSAKSSASAVTYPQRAAGARIDVRELERQWRTSPKEAVASERGRIPGVKPLQVLRCCGITRLRARWSGNRIEIDAEARSLDYLKVLTRIQRNAMPAEFVRVRNEGRDLLAAATLDGRLFGAWVSPQLLRPTNGP